MIYRIGSFNMYKFQAYRSDKEISKDLNKIAEIIRTEQFDIIALQEIFSKTAMNMLLSRLGRNWNVLSQHQYKQQKDMLFYGIQIALNLRKV